MRRVYEGRQAEREYVYVVGTCRSIIGSRLAADRDMVRSAKTDYHLLQNNLSIFTIHSVLFVGVAGRYLQPKYDGNAYSPVIPGSSWVLRSSKLPFHLARVMSTL